LRWTPALPGPRALAAPPDVCGLLASALAVVERGKGYDALAT